MPSRDALLGLGFVWVIAAIAFFGFGSYASSVVTSMLMWMFLCSAWNIIGGFTGQTSFGHSVFFGIGAYASTYLAARFGLSPWLGMMVGGVCAAMAAFVIGYVPFRRGMTVLVFALLTLASCLGFEFLVSGLSVFGGPNGLFTAATGSSFWDLRFEDAGSYLLTIAGMLTVLLLAIDRLLRSRLGVFAAAVRDNEHGAAAVGIDVYKVKQGAFMLSAFATALAGSFYAQHIGFIDPHSVFGLEITIYILLFTVVGGAGTLLGPLLGAGLLVIAGECLRVAFAGGNVAGISNLIFGVVLMLAILLYPKGIWARLARLRRASSESASAIAPVEAAVETAVETAAEPALVSPVAPAAAAPATTDMLEVIGLGKRFGGVRALADVGFSIREGEILGIIGPNGAGKSTLFALLSGFLQPSAGRVLLRGARIDQLLPHQVCALGIARTFQIAQTFSSLSALEVVRTAASVRNPAAAADALAHAVLAEVGLASRQAMASSDLTLVDQRRLEIARALATEPRIILLDEVMAGLTPREVLDASELIRGMRRRGITVVLVEHFVKAVMSLSDRIVVLDSGELIKVGTPAEVAADERVIQAYLGTRHRGAAPAVVAVAPSAPSAAGDRAC